MARSSAAMDLTVLIGIARLMMWASITKVRHSSSSTRHMLVPEPLMSTPPHSGMPHFRSTPSPLFHEPPESFFTSSWLSLGEELALLPSKQKVCSSAG
jgi:hypothetical protein